MAGADEYRHGDVNAQQILEQQRCADPRCECQLSLIRGRGPSHCPSCVAPNLALRVIILRDGVLSVRCKAGCDLAQVQRAVTSPPVTHRTYSRRVSPRDQDGQRRCVGCDKRFLPGRVDQRTCSTRCRQRRRRASQKRLLALSTTAALAAPNPRRT
jgi:predicted nucleic acid-binding Zn ribbon protein